MSRHRIRQQEDRATTQMMVLLGSWLARVREAVLRPFRRLRTAPDPTGLYTTTHVWEAAVDSFIPTLEQVARIGWSAVDGQSTFSSTSFAVTQALTASRNLLRGIPDEVHDLIVQEIIAGLTAGEGADQIAARVERFLSIDDNIHWHNRARVIATTEVTRAANAGALSAALAAEPELGQMVKRWNDSDDQRVRVTHRDVDGEEALLMQPFNVGGFHMLFPGDPSGPPHEVISCRCDLSFRRANG